jgi:hypothetical protein
MVNLCDNVRHRTGGSIGLYGERLFVFPQQELLRNVCLLDAYLSSARAIAIIWAED